MKIEQLFKTEHFANILIDSLKTDKNITASKEKTDKGFLVSYEAKAYASEEIGIDEKDIYSIVNNAVSYLYDEMNYNMGFVRQEIDDLWNYNIRHSDGHLPSVQGTEQMTRAVKALGLDKEYEVAKKTIWASKGGSEISEIQIDA